MKAALICVGSELLRGKINTHVATLSRALAALDIEMTHEETLPDDQPLMVDAIRRVLANYPLVFVTGGLGPTFDDVTREAASEASGHRLVLSEKQLAVIRAKFRRAKYRKMPPANERQAYLLEGALPIPNANGTAPGQWVELAEGRNAQFATRRATRIAHCVLILLPGPPRELQPMLSSFVLPRLRKTFPSRPRAEAHLHFVGIPESRADEAVRPIIEKHAKKGSIDFTILARLGLVDLDVFVSDDSLRKAKARCEVVVREVLRKLHRFCYGRDEDYPLEKVVGDLLRRKRATVATAESCTGGKLAALLTDIPGSSAYVLGGVVAYENHIKEGALDVPAELLRKEGAVSSSVAKAMAEGVRKRFDSTYAIGITGIAGPSGGTPKKPVGLVYIAVAGPRSTVVKECLFGGSRDVVRERAVVMALNQLRLHASF